MNSVDIRSISMSLSSDGQYHFTCHYVANGKSIIEEVKDINSRLGIVAANTIIPLERAIRQHLMEKPMKTAVFSPNNPVSNKQPSGSQHWNKFTTTPFKDTGLDKPICLTHRIRNQHRITAFTQHYEVLSDDLTICRESPLRLGSCFQLTEDSFCIVTDIVEPEIEDNKILAQGRMFAVVFKDVGKYINKEGSVFVEGRIQLNNGIVLADTKKEQRATISSLPFNPKKDKPEDLDGAVTVGKLGIDVFLSNGSKTKAPYQFSFIHCAYVNYGREFLLLAKS